MPSVSPPGASARPGAVMAASGSEAAVGGSGQPPHLSAELVRTLWPMLEAAPKRLGGSPEIAKQLFMLVGKMLTSLRMVLARQVSVTLRRGVVIFRNDSSIVIRRRVGAGSGRGMRYFAWVCIFKFEYYRRD